MNSISLNYMPLVQYDYDRDSDFAIAIWKDDNIAGQVPREFTSAVGTKPRGSEVPCNIRR